MKKALKAAFHYTIPVLCGYLFIGFAFGVMMRDAGFHPVWSFLSSLLIYAGSGQYLLVSLLATNASILKVAVMTLVLNCRHIFYGFSFIETFKQSGKAMPYMVFSLTDETYSLLCALSVPEDIDPPKMRLAIAILDQIYWIAGTLVGAFAGAVVPFDSTGIDFAMTALFVVIFIEQWKNAKNPLPFYIGIGVTLLSLVFFGADQFIFPAMLVICLLLLLLKSSIEREVNHHE